MQDLIALLPKMAQNYVRPQTPVPMKMMAASGKFPLPPQHLGILLLCLAHDHNPQVAEQATKSFKEQPTKIHQYILDNQELNKPNVGPMVMDFMTRHLYERSDLLQGIILHRQTPHVMITWLAQFIEGEGLTLIAQNQQRQLEHPPLIQALLQNQKLSPEHRSKVIEFALRQQLETGLDIESLKEYVNHDLLRELGYETEAATQDHLPSATPRTEELEGIEVVDEDDFELPLEFSEELDDDAPEEIAEEEKLTIEQQILRMGVTEKIKAAMRGNKQIRSMLITDSNRLVSSAVLKNPRITDREVVQIAASRSVSEDIIREVTRNREWMKIYQVKVNLVSNPKCPQGISMRLLNHLRPHDLRSLASSKNIPSLIAVTAKKMLRNRGKR